MASQQTKTVLTGSLAKRASQARHTKDDHRASARAERLARQATHMALLKAQILDGIRKDLKEEEGKINTAVNRGFDSAEVDRIFLPASTKTMEIDEDTGEEMEVVTQEVPQDQTYIWAEGEDPDAESSPQAMLAQGKHDHKTGMNDASALPGGRTVIQLINDELDKEKEGDLAGCLVVLELGRDHKFKVTDRKTGRKRPATVLKVMLVWNMASYTKRRREQAKKREEAREQRTKPSKTMSEYQAEQAAKKEAVTADSEGFVKVKPRRRPRKPEAA